MRKLHAIFDALKKPCFLLDCTSRCGVLDPAISNKEKQSKRPLYYGFFGGRQERGESLIKTAKRELLEEAGLISNKIKFLKAYSPTDAIDWKIYLFITKNCKKVAEPKHGSGEKIQLIKVNFHKFLSILKSNKFHPSIIKEDLISIIKKSKLNQFKKITLLLIIFIQS